jgi:hypothetical protein
MKYFFYVVFSNEWPVFATVAHEDTILEMTTRTFLVQWITKASKWIFFRRHR